jgi:hypothetical protein
MNRLFSKLHISSLLQSNVICSREFASATSVAQPKAKLPKPTANAYALYVKTNFQKGVPAAEQFASIAKAWKTCSVGEKKKFTDEAAKLRKDAIAEFSKLPKKEQKEQFDEAAKSRVDLKNFRRINAYRKFRKETKCPTRPLNAFMLYRQEKYPASTREDIATTAKKAAEEFKKMSDDEKKPYLDKYNQQREAYKADYEKWYKIHGKAYEAVKKEHAKLKKVATKSSSTKRSMGLMSRLKKRRTKRKATPKRKKTAKAVAARRR